MIKIDDINIPTPKERPLLDEIKEAVTEVAYSYLYRPTSDVVKFRDELQEKLTQLIANSGNQDLEVAAKVKTPLDEIQFTQSEFLSSESYPEYELKCASNGKTLEILENRWQQMKEDWYSFNITGNINYEIKIKKPQKISLQEINITFKIDDI